MRIFHFSDIHVGLGLRRVPARDWPGKRVAGGLNLLRGRGRQFARAVEKTRLLVDLAGDLDSDLTLCTGDLTGLATNAEFEAAREALRPLESSGRFVVIPGNHDVYTGSAVRQRRFERQFEHGLATDCPDLRTDGPWPLVRLPDDRTAVVAVNSARANRAPWRSSGRVPAAQLEGLETALADPRLADRFIFLMTHYAPCLPDGRPDSREHGLRNVAELLDAAGSIQRGAFLCGHVHAAFRRRIQGFGGEVFCAGSATAEGREAFWLFDRSEDGWSARRGRWGGARYVVAEDGAPISTGGAP